MPKFAIVKLATLKIHTTYENEKNNQEWYKCDMGNPNLFQHIVVPNTLITIPDMYLKATRLDVATIIIETDTVAYNEYLTKMTEKAWATLRENRNKLLYDCDWTQLPDVSLTETQKEQWRNYRRELRNLLNNTTDPTNPVYPIPPLL